MKQLFSLLFLLVALFAQTAWAQELTIKSFAQSATDITASTEPRLDGNGDACALVKVRLALPNAKFEGETVGSIENRDGEYWVYMVAGSKHLLVKQASVLPLEVKFADYGISRLQAKNTYVLTVLSPQLGQVQQDDGFRFFSMTVKPITAKVKIDNVEVALREDGTYMNPMPQGKHQYEVSLTGYAPQQGTFTIADQKVNLKVTLEKSLTQLSVTCPTEGVAIYINEEKMSDSKSWSGSLPPANYIIEAKKAGYITQRKVITLQQDQPQTITLPALIATMGTLSVSYSPVDAEVWLDGQKLGTTPDLFRNIIAGTHQVEIRKEGFQTASQRITIEEGKTATLSGSLVQAAAAAQSAAAQTSSSMPDQSSAASPVAASGATRTFTVKGVSFTMIAVQGGTFQMGATPEQEDPENDEKPAHTVTLSDYSIGETEVTQALWRAVMGTNPSRFKGDNLPVEQVSWNDCQKFLRKLNKLTGQHFRLPTEAEWEYAARGGNRSLHTMYAGSSNIEEVAWYSVNSNGQTHPVKTKKSNELGLYDMSGNVYEWCQDKRGRYSNNSQTNPTGPTNGLFRIDRGGSWYNISSGSKSTYCRSSYRDGRDPSIRIEDLGLRLAL